MVGTGMVQRWEDGVGGGCRVRQNQPGWVQGPVFTGSCWVRDVFLALLHCLTLPQDGRAWCPPTTVTHPGDNPSTGSVPAPAPCSPSALVFSAKPNQAIDVPQPDLPTCLCSTPKISLRQSSNQLQTQQRCIQPQVSSCLPGASLAPRGEPPQCWQSILHPPWIKDF